MLAVVSGIKTTRQMTDSTGEELMVCLWQNGPRVSQAGTGDKEMALPASSRS